MHSRKEQMKAFGRLLDVLDELREKCPWDRKQTNESLRPNTIEETYELCDALIKGDNHEVCKELGDVLLHVCFYAKIGSEHQSFDIADVCNKLTDKLIFRHPHIYHPSQVGAEFPKPLPFVPSETSEASSSSESSASEQPAKTSAAPEPGVSDTAEFSGAKTAEQVLENWEQIKLREKDGNKSVLSGVPSALPSLIKAYRIQDKARNVGFDWEDRDDVWNKVDEELDELKAELQRGDLKRSTAELGDFLFSVINAARLYKLNPDNALEQTNQKFISRFNYIEQHSIRAGRPLTEMTLAEMDALWNEAKELEKRTKE